MVGLVARWFRWGLFLGALGAISGCDMAQLSSLEEPMDGTLIPTPDQEGSSAQEDENRSIPPAVEDSPDAGEEDEGSSDDEDQDDADTLTVDANPPVAEQQVLGTPMNTALAIALAATDSDDDVLSFALVQDPVHGTISGTAPDFTYVPDHDYVGFDSFAFQADSGRPSGVSNTAVVRIWVVDETDLSGQTVSGYLLPGDTDIWSFQAAAGQRVAIRVSYGYPRARLSLYPPGGGDPETATSHGRIDWRLQSTGQYTVAVENPWSVSIGYNLTVLVLERQLVSLLDLDGGPIAPGETLPGRLAPAGDIDAYTFEGIAGRRVIITVSYHYPSASFALYPPGGGEQETSSFDRKIDWTLRDTGLYTIVVERDVSVTINYNLTLQQF